MNAMSNAERQRLYRLRRKGKAPAPARVTPPITQRETGDVTGLAAEWAGRDDRGRKALGQFLDMMRLWERAEPEARDAVLQMIGSKVVRPATFVDTDTLVPGPYPSSAFSIESKLSKLESHLVRTAQAWVGEVRGTLNNPRSRAQRKHYNEAMLADAEAGLRLAQEIAREYRQALGVPLDHELFENREDWTRGDDGVWRRDEPDET